MSDDDEVLTPERIEATVRDARRLSGPDRDVGFSGHVLTADVLLLFKNQRDRALALLRECQGSTSCATGSSGDPCKRHGEAEEYCAECRRRALFAEVDPLA